jgi:hypothetical protein
VFTRPLSAQMRDGSGRPGPKVHAVCGMVERCESGTRAPTQSGGQDSGEREPCKTDHRDPETRHHSGVCRRLSHPERLRLIEADSPPPPNADRTGQSGNSEGCGDYPEQHTRSRGAVLGHGDKPIWPPVRWWAADNVLNSADPVNGGHQRRGAGETRLRSDPGFPQLDSISLPEV